MFGDCDFTGNRPREALAHFGGREAPAEEVHEFCYRGLESDVVTGYHASGGYLVAGKVSARVHAAVDTLGYVHYHYAICHRLGESVEEPLLGRAVLIFCLFGTCLV